MDDTHTGVWICPKHGAMLNGMDAALRAGYISCIHVEPGAAA
jgi:hypothetical protein